MSGMSFRVQGWCSARLALGFLLLVNLLAHAVSARADTDDVEASAAALESGSPQAVIAEDDIGQGPSLDSAVYDRIATSELVARVKITGVHRMIDNALSEPGMVAILGYVYSGVAEKIWKGAPSNLIAFRLTLDDCDRKLERGEQYLIFANADAQGRLQLSSCEAAVAGADAVSLLGQLNRYYQG